MKSINDDKATKAFRFDLTEADKTIPADSVLWTYSTDTKCKAYLKAKKENAVNEHVEYLRE